MRFVHSMIRVKDLVPPCISSVTYWASSRSDGGKRTRAFYAGLP